MKNKNFIKSSLTLIVLSLVLIAFPNNNLFAETTSVVEKESVGTRILSDEVLVIIEDYDSGAGEIGILSGSRQIVVENPNLGTPARSPFSAAASAGARTTKHSTSTASSLPPTSSAYSSKDLISGGKVKQRRYYGSSGKAYKDIDYFHGGVGHVFPHAHYWNWNGPTPIRP